MLHNWFGFIHHHNKVKVVEEEQKSKMMNHASILVKPTMIVANKKLAPTVKATSVNVTIDEITLINDESNISIDNNNNEPLRSASISLSIELAKKTSMSSISIQQSPILTQKPDTIIITPQSSLPKSMVIHKQQQQRPCSVHSSNSLLHRMAHSPKAAAAAFPTSVSANGNVVHDSYHYQQKEQEQEQLDTTIRSSSSAAVKSLSRKMEEFSPTSSPPNELSSSLSEEEEEKEEEEEHTLEDEAFDSQEVHRTTDQVKKEDAENHSSMEKKKEQEYIGFWTWLGFPSSTNPSDKTKSMSGAEKEEVKQLTVEYQHQDVESAYKNKTSSSSIPPTIEEETDNNNNGPVTSNVSKTSISTKRSSWASFLFQTKPTPSASLENIPSTSNSKEIIDLRKVKSTSSLQPTITATTQSLRSSASASSFCPILPKKKNQVLPPFDSQFINNNEPATTTTAKAKTPSANILTKAMDAINSILIQPPPDQPEDTSNWIAKRMKAKFSNFVDDLKLYATNKPASVLMDKRIVVIGVHGWFPMKVDIHYLRLLFHLI
jgi:hypothetical protein